VPIDDYSISVNIHDNAGAAAGLTTTIAREFAEIYVGKLSCLANQL
jgi:hypothetical protein